MQLQHKGLDPDAQKMLVDTFQAFAARRLTPAACRDLDARDHFPLDIIKELLGPEIGLHLLFIPEEHGGLGGGAYDVYKMSEAMARVDLGVATAFLAIFLGTDPIVVGATAEQKAKWMRRIAEEGLIVAYGVTEPLAGSEVSAIRTKADRIVEDGKITGYKINGNKQFITNGGVAQLYTVLAAAPEGPSFFVVEAGTKGFSSDKHEDKHGIRSSNTTPLTLEDVVVPVENLIGGVEGKGLAHAQSVFGFTRLMVAAFGLGAGVAAQERAIKYSRERIQAGGPLCEKQAFMDKLIVPHVCRLEAARAYIEETAMRLDQGEPELQTEGAIAKLLATEFGNAAADAAIQAHGGYGYIREYDVEKIKRDARITTIYEGTSEIMEWTIARDRWRVHLQGRGEFFQTMAKKLDGLHREAPDVGADVAAMAVRAVNEAMERARVGRLTRNQHVLFRLGEMIGQAEMAANFCRYAAGACHSRYQPHFAPSAVKAMSRVFARDAALHVALEATRWVRGCDAAGAAPTGLDAAVGVSAITNAYAGQLADMDTVSAALVAQAAQQA